MSPPQCLNALAEHKIDFAFIGSSIQSNDELFQYLHKHHLNHISLPSDSIVALINKASPLAEKYSLMLSDLHDQVFITYSTFVNAEQYGYPKVISLSNFENIVQMVNDNIGFSLLPSDFVQQHLAQIGDNIAIIPVIDSGIFNFIIYPAHKPLTAAQKFFISLYKRNYENAYFSNQISNHQHP